VEFADLRAIVEQVHLYWVLTNVGPDAKVK
jgi:hypothetical protein